MPKCASVQECARPAATKCTGDAQIPSPAHSGGCLRPYRPSFGCAATPHPVYRCCTQPRPSALPLKCHEAAADGRTIGLPTFNAKGLEFRALGGNSGVYSGVAWFSELVADVARALICGPASQPCREVVTGRMN